MRPGMYSATVANSVGIELMAQRGTRRARRSPRFARANVRIGVGGYKSIREEVIIDLRHLTLLAGANSSGKSSFIQALLLLKQTLEAQFDPGALLLNGPNVALTSTTQLFSRGKSKDDVAKRFVVTIDISGQAVTIAFSKPRGQAIGVSSMRVANAGEDITISSSTTSRELEENLPSRLQDLLRSARESAVKDEVEVRVRRERCFLVGEISIQGARVTVPLVSMTNIRSTLLDAIHVPGLRGNPARVYPSSAVGRAFPGTFEKYVASLIHAWQVSTAPADKRRISNLNHALQALGLTWKVEARPLDETSVELLVGRTLYAQQGGAWDLVNIADVGFGVSQTLPVLVALAAARPGQIVYLEQPEIHLHPRAQTALGRILVEYATRGIFVVAETHSSLIIKSVQTEIAKKTIDPQRVALHWFSRSASGNTAVETASLDEQGRFGDWPADFDEVTLQAEVEFLEAVEESLDDDEAP